MMQATLRLECHHGSLEAYHGSHHCGTYHFQDPHKPYWHPLCSPKGLCVTLARPHDHPHHQGLMYALRTEDCNFMEESPCAPHEETGRQVHTGFSTLTNTGPTVSFTQSLEWRGNSSGRLIFTEERQQSLTISPSGGLLLSWHARITPVQSVRLIQSKWSRPDREGNLINYHGIIIRLPRSWSSTGNYGFAADRVPMDAATALGLRVREACYYGAFDGFPTPVFASVTLRQRQNHRLCLRDSPFAWMTLGPSNGGPVELPAGIPLEEYYELEIQDGKPPFFS